MNQLSIMDQLSAEYRQQPFDQAGPKLFSRDCFGYRIEIDMDRDRQALPRWTVFNLEGELWLTGHCYNVAARQRTRFPGFSIRPS